MLERGDPPRDARGGEAEQLELLRSGGLLDQPVGDAEGDDAHLGVGGLQRLGQVRRGPQQCLYFLPLLQGQGSLRPIRRRAGAGPAAGG